MLKLNENEYNLDNLLGINFDLLKEILLKLAQSDNKISLEINDINNTNIFRDQRISDLEQKITELNNTINNIDNNMNEKEKEIKNLIKEEKKIEINFEGSNTNELNINKDSEKKPQLNKDKDKDLISIKKIDDFIISNEELKQLEDEHANTETIKEEINFIKSNDLIINKEKTVAKNKNINIPNLSSYYLQKPLTSKKYQTDINLINISNNPLLTPKKDSNKQKEEIKKLNENIRNISHEINSLKDHINFVEKNLLIKNSETLQISKDLLSEHNNQSMSKFNSLDKQLSNIISKNEQISQALNHLAQKYEDNSSFNLKQNSNIKPEIIQIFNSNDDEDNDKKIIPKSFLDSIDKRFELNNERYMKAFEDSNKMKQNIININGALDNINRHIDLLKKNNKEIKEDISKIKEQIDEIIETKNKESNKNSDDISPQYLNEINNYIDKKFNELSNSLLGVNDDKNKDNNNQIQKNISDGTLVKLLNQKMKQLNERIEFIEEESKLLKKSFNMKYKDIDSMSKKVDELNETLIQKLEKKDLDEIYILNKRNTDEINKMRLKVEEISIGQEKIRNDTPNFIKRLESLTNDVSEIKDLLNMKKGDYTLVKKEYNTKLEEYNDINEDKIKNMISPMAEEIQKLIIEIENINIKIKTITEQNKLLIKKKHVEKIESNLNDKINSLENILDSKYLKRSEFQKMVKTFDIQIKLLQGNTNNNNNNINQKQESENWILAKQPLKCFNCASCEANVRSNSLQQNEPIARSKYHGQYMIGQGFSKLLKKLNTNRTIEEKEKDLDKSEKRNKLLNNSFENIEFNQILMMNNRNENIKKNNKIPGTEDKQVYANLKKYKLPKLFEGFKKKQKSVEIPVSDEEKDENSENEEGNPKILKITKVNKYEEISQINQNVLEINNQIKNKTGRNSENKYNTINRIQSLPLY